MSAGGGHGGALPLQTPAQAQPEVPGRLPAGRGHPEGHARLHRGCAHSSAAVPGQHALALDTLGILRYSCMQHARTSPTSYTAACESAMICARTAAETQGAEHDSSCCKDSALNGDAACQMRADMDRRPVLQVYEKLNAEGRFQEKLLEMYRWGKANGWDAAPSTVQ